jgi:hypothetical protein
VPDADAAAAAEPGLREIVARMRIGSTPRLIVADGRAFEQILHETSATADLVVLGLAEPGDDFVRYYERMQKLTDGLPSTLFVLAAEDLEFGTVLI